MTAEDVEEVTRIERREMQRRERAYRGGRGPLNMSGLVVILVDDGIATGASIRAGIRALRQMKPARGGRGPLNMSGLVVILVDDGIATGASIRAGIRALRQMKPARIVVAVPVAPPSTCDHLRAETDELMVLEKPEIFFGVGQFYTDFSEVSDEQVIDLLTRAWHQSAEPKVSGAEIAHKGARQ